MNKILQDINKDGWFLLFSSQSPSNMIMVFKRARSPEFVVSVIGNNENRMLGKAELIIAWIYKLIKKHDLEAKFDEFLVEQNERIKYMQNKIRKYAMSGEC